MKIASLPILPGFLLLATISRAQMNYSGNVSLTSEIYPVKNISEVRISTYPAEFMSLKDRSVESNDISPEGATVKWSKAISKPVWVNVTGMFIKTHLAFLAEPGDEITVKYVDEVPVFSGKGNEKWNLAYKIMKIHDSMARSEERRSLPSLYGEIKSVQEYLSVSNLMNKEQKIIREIIDSYKSRISPVAYQNIMTAIFEYIEWERVNKFTLLKVAGQRNEKNKFGLTNKDLCAIYDSTLNSPAAEWLQSNNASTSALSYQWRMLKLELYRKKGKFFLTHEQDSLLFGSDLENSYIEQYNLAKKKYKGLSREKLLAYTFWNPSGLISEIGFTPKVDSLFSDYYNNTDYPTYKAMVKDYEIKYREKYKKVFIDPFTLTNVDGQPFSSSKLNGKIVVLDFWFTGCKGCVQMAPALQKVIEFYKDNPDIEFVSVSIDKDENKWLKSISEGIYTASNGTHLYTGGIGAKHEILQKMFISSYPTIFIFDKSGRIIPYNKYKNDPRLDSGRSLIEVLNREIAMSQDGPYIIYNENGFEELSFSGDKATSRFIPKDSFERIVKTRTDQNKEFEISLKNKLSIEPSVYERPSEMFILSDIEGNFEALRNLLVNNKIIDNQFNWIFGKGHLIFAGDMFDRGRQVNECLWLIYALEEKAKAAGGYVHFILGNHEIMNLSGDVRYNVDKYLTNARKVNKTPSEFYSANTELGRWLRTKNIMEKIGDLLICHGGVSQKINELSLSVEEINNRVRPYYDQPYSFIKDSITRILTNTSTAPYWYRGYYEGNNQGNYAQFDSTLAKFDVKHILIGHTIVSDTISNSHKGRIFNTDTKHAEGHSEAIYINGSNYYRVNKEGIRIPFYFED